ncbi:MAG TPA: hypothetical protein ENN09_04745 [Planctomycetes bacterium]|nr:hypothetical protein [Planctomycetota bacterium]
MPERNTALLVATILFVVFACASSGAWFALMLEHDRLLGAYNAERVQLNAAREKITRRRIELSGDGSGQNTGLRGQLATMEVNIKKIEERIADNKRWQEDAKSKAATSIADVQPATDGMFSSIQRGFADIQDERRKMQTAEDAFKREKQTLMREIERVKRELKRKKEENETDIATIQSEIARVQTDLNEVEEKLRILTERRELADVLEEDGEIITVGPPNTNYVAINLGWADLVRKGMRFDVFETRGSDTRVRKGKIEITSVNARSSDCIVLPAKRRNPLCPQCGWEAEKPDMRNCAYCALGDNNDEVQQLDEKVAGILIAAQDPFHPIVRGDKISNPFYYKGRKVRFAFTGEPVKRSRREIDLFIKEHGGILDPEITLQTDYLVVGTGEHVKDALNKARRFGVKILQEPELYQFFGKEE